MLKPKTVGLVLVWKCLTNLNYVKYDFISFTSMGSAYFATCVISPLSATFGIYMLCLLLYPLKDMTMSNVSDC